ncbi:accessory gene regulator B family protein [Paenibacillus oleatilyticus]|uniref:accessory gene regulator B family protein n=1 Tax=Paenibacillus oleatilyticus TaxID=2594886 RepID=UPI001C1F99FB|nr:accessory gene regulator B family protein [Paenibacillus oleatilyticus]MBU7320831.1 accessory gene regulator B family protein [Paenibacillus oleatilyticus]
MNDPIEIVASKLAHLSKKWNPEITDHVEDIRYGVALRINYYSVVLGCLIIGFVTGKVLETIVSMISFILLRRFTGGLHMPTLTLCFFVSIALMSGIPHISLAQNISIVLNIISLVLVLFLSERRQRHNLMGACMLIGSNFILNSDVIAMSFLAQSVLLIRLGKGVKQP